MSRKNPDRDFVLHGRTSSYWSKPGYLSNTRLTTTTDGWNDYSAKEYKDHYDVPQFTNALRSMSKSLTRVSSDLKQTLYGPESENANSLKPRDLHSSLNTSATDEELLRLMKRNLETKDSYNCRPPSPKESHWCTNPTRLSRTTLRSTSRFSNRSRSPSPVGNTYFPPRSRSPPPVSHSRSRSLSPVRTTVPLGPILDESISASNRVGREMALKRHENQDALAARYFPVTLGAAFYLQAADSKTGAPLPVYGKDHVRPSTSYVQKSDLTKSAQARSAARIDELLNDVDYRGTSRQNLMANSRGKTSSVNVVSISPYQAELARLRMERLQIEEDKLLEIKRQEELERIRGPKPKWYEMKSPEFHYEAHKNNQLLRSREKWDDLLAYREELNDASKLFQRSWNSPAIAYS